MLYFPPLTGNTWASTAPASLGRCQLQLDSLKTLTLRQPTQAAASVRLLDALGREVVRQSTAGTQTLISVAALDPGLYAGQWLDTSGRVLMSRKVAHQQKLYENSGAFLTPCVSLRSICGWVPPRRNAPNSPADADCCTAFSPFSRRPAAASR